MSKVWRRQPLVQDIPCAGPHGHAPPGARIRRIPSPRRQPPCREAGSPTDRVGPRSRPAAGGTAAVTSPSAHRLRLSRHRPFARQRHQAIERPRRRVSTCASNGTPRTSWSPARSSPCSPASSPPPAAKNRPRRGRRSPRRGRCWERGRSPGSSRDGSRRRGTGGGRAPGGDIARHEDDARGLGGHGASRGIARHASARRVQHQRERPAGATPGKVTLDARSLDANRVAEGSGVHRGSAADASWPSTATTRCRPLAARHSPKNPTPA